MKKLLVFIFFLTFLSTSLVLPRKALALNCPNGVSGQFLDTNTKQPILAGWILKIDGVTEPSSKIEPEKHMRWGNSDSQGNFSIPGPLNGYLELSWNTSGYLSEEMVLNKCTGLTIYLKPISQNTNPLCGQSCKDPINCARATDGCTSCVQGVCAHPSWGGYANQVCVSDDDKERENCLRCIEGGGSWTALGCLPTNKPADFVNWLLKFSIGIGGGIAFLLMIFGGLQIILSAGNPEKIKAGKEIITAALGGLILIIFSIFILRLIGYDILRIPGFNP